MHQHRKITRLFLVFALLATVIGPLSGCAKKSATTDSDTTRSSSSASSMKLPTDTPAADVPYVPTPEPVVNRMLKLADVDKNDVVYDLGSGDGRIVIKAAKKYGARGVGIEINPKRVKEARRNAKAAGVADLVEFRQGDLFKADISEATVVTLYLLPSVNRKLRPKLFKELEPGTVVVSHDFDMGTWKPEQTVEMNGDTIYLWTIPEEIPEHLRGQ